MNNSPNVSTGRLRLTAGRLWKIAMVVVLVMFSTGMLHGSERPNFVVILLDNLGQEWLGCYGSEEGCTPRIDQLAAQGVRFENCYTAPVCGPSRIMFLTGRYPFSTGFNLHHDAALYSGGGLDPARERTFASLLHDAGYATCISGKWQINNLYDEPGILKKHGFDETIVWPGSVDRDRVDDEEYQQFLAGIEAFSYERTAPTARKIESRYWDPVVIRNGTREVLQGRFGPDVFQEAGIDFIRRNATKPFLLYVPLTLTHGRTFADPTVHTPLNMNPDRPEKEMFADMVRYSDQIVGGFIDELKRLKLDRKTIVIVATDNGTESRLIARRNGREVRGDLYQLTEAGGNVGLVAYCPNLIPGGRTVSLADFTDILPTLCDFAGAGLPADLKIDGVSQAGILRGGSGVKPPRNWILNQYNTRRVVRDEQYKLYSTGEFYDANNDPEELRNLSDSPDPRHQAARQKLQGVLDSLPADNPSPFKLRSQSAFKLEALKSPPHQEK